MTPPSELQATTAPSAPRVPPSGSREALGPPVANAPAKRVGPALRRAIAQAPWEELTPPGAYPRRGRRLFDLALLALFGVPALVIGGGVALANLVLFRRLDRVLYAQPRVGLRGEVFTILKFRTMSEAPAAAFESWESGGDRARVTRFGRFLRNTHLDELPQLINVLRGDMAFVGPRPEMVEIEAWAAEEVEGFVTRLAVPPGITGYAQVTQGYTGSDVAAYREKFWVADWYRRNQSFALDLEIVARTFVWMLRGRGWQWNATKRPPASD